MKQRQPGRVERRRSLVELNLIADRVKDRARPRRRGCLPFTMLGLVLAVTLTAVMGLHQV